MPKCSSWDVGFAKAASVSGMSTRLGQCSPPPLTHRHTVLGWVDLAVPDGDVAREFYAAVLGWTYAGTGEEFGHYQMVNTKVAQQPASARRTTPTSHRPG